MSNRPVDFEVFVPGRPVSKGNMAPGGRRGVYDKTVGLWPWARAIQAAVLEHRCNPPAKGAFRVECEFFFFGTGKYHTSVPDLDKLQRAVLDALTKYIWHDDCMVVEIHARKKYGGRKPGLRLRVTELAGQLTLA